MRRLLIMRLSAMGDVAMTIPVVYSLAKQHSALNVTVLTRNRLTCFFGWMPANVNVIGVDLNEYKGIAGLGRLYKELKSYDFDAVADLHDVLRTKYLRFRFLMDGKKVAVIDKGRREKQMLLGHGLDHQPLKPVVKRYNEVFEKLGLDFKNVFDHIHVTESEISEMSKHINIGSQFSIGIAPFAAHPGKVYPLNKMKEVAYTLADNGNHIYLFGAGKYETDILSSWERDGIVSVAGKMGGLKNELVLMSRLNIMISMDSSNMHMAALMGTQTISIWGPTHPKAGFVAWKQPEKSIVQLVMDCRPCSIYGNKPCHIGGYPCLNNIDPLQIVKIAQEYGAK